MRAHVRVGLHVPSLIADEGGLLVLTTTGRSNTTILCDCNVWKPQKTVFEGFYVIHAARSPSGRWFFHGSMDLRNPREWRLRTYDRGVETPSTDEPEPFTIDASPVLALLEGADLQIESAQTHAIDGVWFLGESELVIPRHVGVGERRWPWMKKGGGWVELRELPSFTKDPKEKGERPHVETIRLGDGADLLLWNGSCFELRDGGDDREGAIAPSGKGRFVRTFEHKLDLEWFVDQTPVRAGSDGFFCIAANALVEVHRGAEPPKRHLPDMSISALKPGPNGTLLVRGDGWMLYDPNEETIATLWEELDRATFVRATSKSIIAGTDLGSTLEFLGSRVLADLEWTPVSKRAPSHVAPSYEGRLPASRPRVAVIGERTIAIVKNNEVRLHTVDAPLARATFDEEIVSVVASGGRFLALEISGALHTIDPTNATVIASRKIADRPRALVGSERAIAVLEQDSVEIGGRVFPFDAPIAGAFGEDGALLVVSNSGEACIDGSPAPRAPEKIHALARGPGGWLALGEKSLLRFSRTEGWSIVREAEPGTHIACSDDGKRIAWCSTMNSASLIDGKLDERSFISTPDRLSEPDEPISVIGLGFLDDDRWIVGYSGARANILLPKGAALKLDAFPGDPRSRWVFVYDGNILIAD